MFSACILLVASAIFKKAMQVPRADHLRRSPMVASSIRRSQEGERIIRTYPALLSQVSQPTRFEQTALWRWSGNPRLHFTGSSKSTKMDPVIQLIVPLLARRSLDGKRGVWPRSKSIYSDEVSALTCATKHRICRRRIEAACCGRQRGGDRWCNL